ncbi:MAG TPA: ROK family protein [Bacteroidales bacterium]|nr:ROK family protein [Bacteroidales bacterium]HRZ76608.1 ROK family protein [Bacteroidales bacterium]
MYTVGVDIGGTTTKLGLVEEGGRVLSSSAFNTADQADAQAFAATLAFQVRRLVAGAEIAQAAVKGIGIGAPNGNFHKGTIEYPPNLSFKGITPLVAMMKAYFPSWEIRLTNDANAAALGEKVYGKAKDVDDFIVITLGTGLGSGIYVEGRLVYGHDGFAGELGHVIVEPGGRACGCGRQGCLETYASATGLVRTYQELVEKQTGISGDLSQEPEEHTARGIAEAAERGDSLALETFLLTATRLGLALANAVAVTSPRVIYLFGGLTAAGELLMAPLQEAFDAHLLNVYQGKVRLEISGLPGSEAAILGAAALLD